MNDENPKPNTKKCQHCGKEMGAGLTMHEKYCKENPVNKKPTLEAQPESKRSPLIITDVLAIKIDADNPYDVAWFEDEKRNKYKKTPLFFGQIHYDSGDVVPSALIMSEDGNLIPPTMIPEFIGMFPNDHEFPELPEPVEVSGTEDEKQTAVAPMLEIKEETPARIITPPPEIHAQEQKKKSLFAGIFGKKDKKAPIAPAETTKDLIDRINEVKTTT